MSTTVVEREALCVYAGGAWALQGSGLYEAVRSVARERKGKRSGGGLFNNSVCVERYVKKTRKVQCPYSSPDQTPFSFPMCTAQPVDRVFLMFQHGFICLFMFLVLFFMFSMLRISHVFRVCFGIAFDVYFTEASKVELDWLHHR